MSARWQDTAEGQRLLEAEARAADWKHWGPYVAERAWGTVREDYSEDGEAWLHFTHEQARSRAYRWSEDGLAGFCNRFQNTCLALALWNEKDPILKERLFGLSGKEGNHGEDVKEYYHYLEGTPTHSWMRMLYRYPQAAFPYQRLLAEGRRRSREQPEAELADLLRSELEQGRFFDVVVDYAKAGPEDLLCRIVATNRGPEAAPLHLLPHLWHRNSWSWGHPAQRPLLEAVGPGTVCARHKHLGERFWTVRGADGAVPELLFCENETNTERLFDWPNLGPYPKDAIHEAVVARRRDAVNPARVGTKVAAHLSAVVPPGGSYAVWVRFAPTRPRDPFADLEAILARRREEHDAYHASIEVSALSPERRAVQRQALAGLLWSKQFYHYSVELWLGGDATLPIRRKTPRNAGWKHVTCLDVLSMPDKWEYPWFAAWDTAFQALPLALVDRELAKRQLVVLLREWYMHPNGQIPAYEWSFGDVNPPVHAWAALRVYQLAREADGRGDTVFLERVFHKLLLNFTWWVNRTDRDGNNAFEGGFLGLDNIGLFNRSEELPGGVHLEQADGTAWMAHYCLSMLAIALELAQNDAAYEDVATKFFEHFVYIANAFYHLGGSESQVGLWDEQDGFFYDVVHTQGGILPLKVRSFVGLIPLLAVEVVRPEVLERLPRFRRRMEWFLRYRPHLLDRLCSFADEGAEGGRLLAVVSCRRLERVLERVLDEDEFLSPYGLRSLSRGHAAEPYRLRLGEREHVVAYEPAEARSGLFGGNSNWRGPVWFPINYLFIEALRKYGHHYGERLRVELPRGSGRRLTLDEVADELSRRLVALFLPDASGRRPAHGDERLFQDPRWREQLLFHEYFHGDTGQGLGASHQTGWTALVACLLQGSDRLAVPPAPRPSS